jgi:hypothetical protein
VEKKAPNIVVVKGVKDGSNELWVKTHYTTQKLSSQVLHLVFLCKYKHHILDYFSLFEVYWIRFRLKTINYKENSNKD